MQTLTNFSPIAWTVIGSIFILSLFLVLGLSIAGSYLLTVHYVQAYQAHLTAAQLKNAIGTCKSLYGLAHSGQGVHLPSPNAAHPAELALTKLFAGINKVYTSSGCVKVLAHIHPTSTPSP